MLTYYNYLIKKRLIKKAKPQTTKRTLKRYNAHAEVDKKEFYIPLKVLHRKNIPDKLPQKPKRKYTRRKKLEEHAST